MTQWSISLLLIALVIGLGWFAYGAKSAHR